MNIVIIGTGWLGHALAEKLAVNPNYKVSGSKRTAAKLTSGTAYHPFVFPSEEGSALLAQADTVVLAFPPDRSTTERYAEDCLQIVKLIPPTCRIVLTSSTGVYPDTSVTCFETDPIHESQPGNPLVLAEAALLQQVASRLTIVRLAGLIGPGRYPVRFMVASGKTYEGNVPVNVIHQQDAVGFVAFVIENALQGEIFNACAPSHPSKGSFYTAMASHLGIASPLFTASGQGKTVDASKSVAAGYHYLFPEPMAFPEVSEK